VVPDPKNDWRPTASLEILKRRAQVLAQIREFFAKRGVLEVETPLLSAAGTTDPNLHSYMARSLAAGDPANPRYLHTSPEFAMKRLVASGSGSIYQICKVFRGGENGRRHNPEFTMLEWYRVGYDYHQLMDEVAALATDTLADSRRFGPAEKLSYADAFERHAGLDPHTASAAAFAAAARERDIDVSGLALDRDGWRDLLLTHLVEPHLGRDGLCFIYDYPASAAALARIRPGDRPVAERFELYLDGVELANGFQELVNAAEQRDRFAQDRRVRADRGLPAVPADEHLLTAIENGLPACSGVALGVDRLVMLAVGATSIADVVSFPADRA
jgi:elongation factor P--(R)-beta-lysine ligase